MERVGRATCMAQPRGSGMRARRIECEKRKPGKKVLTGLAGWIGLLILLRRLNSAKKLCGFINGQGEAFLGVGEATSFWKRGSFRSGSNIGSSRSSAGVSGGAPRGNSPMYGIESSFCKAAMARLASFICAATRANISIGAGPWHSIFLDRDRGHGAF